MTAKPADKLSPFASLLVIALLGLAAWALIWLVWSALS